MMQDFRTAEEWEQLHQYANSELRAELARLRAENERLKARVEELQAALEPFAHGDLRQYEQLPDDTILILCVSGMERRPDIAEARWLRLGDLRRAAAVAEADSADPAERVLGALEMLAREWGEATVIKVRVDKPLADWTEVRVDMCRGKLRHFVGVSGGRNFPMITRAEALALLRKEKGE